MTFSAQQPDAPGWGRALDAARGCPRCGARTRSGSPCKAPAVAGRRRCRMHGGAEGSGAPPGERNGNYRNGYWTKEAIDERRHLRALVRMFGGAGRAV